MSQSTGEQGERAKRRKLDRMAWLLDRSIPLPGTNFRFGLDPIIGLIPGLGDAFGALLSSYIMVEAFRMGSSTAVLVRMALNIALETIVGVVPLLGNVFDAWWKANTRNIDLMERFLDDPEQAAQRARRSNWFFLFAIVFGLLAIALVIVALGLLILVALVRLLGG